MSHALDVVPAQDGAQIGDLVAQERAGRVDAQGGPSDLGGERHVTELVTQEQLIEAGRELDLEHGVAVVTVELFHRLNGAMGGRHR